MFSPVCGTTPFGKRRITRFANSALDRVAALQHVAAGVRTDVGIGVGVGVSTVVKGWLHESKVAAINPSMTKTNSSL
jgi:hypothetical protein